MLKNCRRALGILSRETCFAPLKTGSGNICLQLDAICKITRRSSALHWHGAKTSLLWRGRGLSLDHGPQPWSEEESTRLLELKDAGLSYKAVLAHFPNRTILSVKSQYQRLRMSAGPALRSRSKPWTAQELEKRNALRAKGLSWAQIAQQLPGRTVHAVARAHLCNQLPRQRTAKRWTDEETAQLQYLVEDLGLSWQEVAQRMPHRSRRGLLAKYWELSEPTTKQFTQKESKLILDLKSQGFTFAEIAKKLPGWSENSISTHYYNKRHAKLSSDRKFIKKWNSNEDAELVRLRKQGKLWREIEETLGLAPRAGNERLKRLKEREAIVSKYGPTQRREWTAAEDLRLKEMREQGQTWAKIGQAFGCSDKSAANRYNKLVEQKQSKKQADAKIP